MIAKEIGIYFILKNVLICASNFIFLYSKRDLYNFINL